MLLDTSTYPGSDLINKTCKDGFEFNFCKFGFFCQNTMAFPYRLTSQTRLELKNPDIYNDKAYVNGKWVEAKSKKRFEIIGNSTLSIKTITTH